MHVDLVTSVTLSHNHSLKYGLSVTSLLILTFLKTVNDSQVKNESGSIMEKLQSTLLSPIRKSTVIPSHSARSSRRQ